MKRLVAILHNKPDSIFSVKQFRESIEDTTDGKYPDNTYYVYLGRLVKMGITEKVAVPRGAKPVYRCLSVFKAKSYLDGHYPDYTPGMAPTNPPIRPADSIRHRPVYKLQLSNSELELARGIGRWEQFGRSPGYWRLNNKDFSMRVWSSGKARMFLKDDWREAVSKVFGLGLVEQLQAEITNGNGDVGWARKPQIESKNLPVGNVFRVVNPEGKVSIFQYGFSQIKSGELDRHGPENEPYADLTEKWLFDELKFKTDLVSKIASLDRILEGLSQNQLKTNDLLSQLINGKPKPPEEQPYQAPSEDKRDYSYR